MPAWTAEAAAESPREILVTGQKADATIDKPPATTVTIDAARIAQTVNAVSVEDALKYAPSLVIRKRSIGDNFAPLATRTSGLSGIVPRNGTPTSVASAWPPPAPKIACV